MSFNVTPSGGNVVTSKTNFFIELSPYFVPFYTILLGLVFWGVGATGNATTKTSEIFLFLVGFTMAFHFVMTADALKLQQADVVKSGLIFSFVVIFISNLIVVTALFTPIFESVSFMGFIKEAWSGSAAAYQTTYTKGLELWNTGPWGK